MTESHPPSSAPPTEPPSERSSERRIEKALDVLLGLSSFSWAVLGLLHEAGPPLLARLGASLVNATVGLLFLIRSPAKVSSTNRELLRALPSALAGLAAWRLSGDDWPPALALAFLSVAVLVSVTLLFLGRSFAIFPALRTVKARGPYRVVRHPLYALELLLVALSGAVYAWWAGAGLALVTALALIPRIEDEERVLAQDPRYAAYQSEVRYRLLPGVY